MNIFMFDDIFVILIFFIIGLLIGSFINAAEYRMNKGERITWSAGKGAERSKCIHCATTLVFFDLVPVLSFIALRGNCRYCQKSISWQYPIVELVSAIACAAAAVRFGLSIQAVFVAIFSTILLFIFIYDYKYQLILDKVSVPAMLLAAVAAWIMQRDAVDLAIGALIGGGFFWLQYVASRGKWIGGGDIRLGILMGLLLGWQVTIAALILSYVGGAIIAVILIVQKKAKMQSHIPFGTFLTVATFACLLFGEEIVQWYLGLIL